MRFKLIALCVIAVIAAMVSACGASDVMGRLQVANRDAAATPPPGPEGDLIKYGRDLFDETPKYAAKYVTARMSCAACHPNGGTVAHEGSLLGQYAKFPQYNSRSHRFIALQDRLAECFLYSMNGHPPPYYSREMIAMTAYIAWLSRGARVGEGFPDQGLLKITPPDAPNTLRGADIYAAKCARCHGADGNGAGSTYPPLWGPQSFAQKAGMSRIDVMARFVYASMPQDRPLTLTSQEAYDVAEFVLSHPRPQFNKSRQVQFQGQKAGYF